MSNITAERPVAEKNQNFAELMAEIAELEPDKQEKITGIYVSRKSVAGAKRKGRLIALFFLLNIFVSEKRFFYFF